MHLNIVEETEWDAAGELGYVIQAAQNMRIHYFNAIVLGVHRSDIQDGYRFITAIFCRIGVSVWGDDPNSIFCIANIVLLLSPTKATNTL